VVQSVRETAVIKILENGVRLGLKLQTSHIASMYFETWLDRKKSAEADEKAPRSDLESWME